MNYCLSVNELQTLINPEFVVLQNKLHINHILIQISQKDFNTNPKRVLEVGTPRYLGWNTQVPRIEHLIPSYKYHVYKTFKQSSLKQNCRLQLNLQSISTQCKYFGTSLDRRAHARRPLQLSCSFCHELYGEVIPMAYF